MLDESLKQQLKSYLEKVSYPILLRLTLDDSNASEELNQLASEIAELSPHITVSSDGQLERTPTLEVVSERLATSVAFSGIPLGHEFTSLVLALLNSGGHPFKLDSEMIEQIRSINEEFKFESYISLSCQNCPEVVQALNTLALLNKNITHTMIDGALFAEEVEERSIKAVPTVFLNGKAFSTGRISLKEIVNKIDKSAALKEAKALSQKPLFDMLIIGGGPAGASAAIYSARKGLKTGLVAERFGGQVTDTVGIENFISVKHTEGPKLVSQLEQHVLDYDVDVMTEQKVAQIQKNNVFTIVTESGAELKAKSIVVATGARWRKINVPGELEYLGKGVAYCPHCDGPLFKGKSVAVIGGGNSGIEAAIDLANIVSKVTVLEFSDVLRADEVLLKKARSMQNIEIVTEAQTQKILGDGNQVTHLEYLCRKTNEIKRISLAGIFVQIGLVPNTEFLKETLELSARGEIEVNAKGETSMAGVFAAGDVTTVPYKQIIIAMGEGAKASLGAFEYLMRQQPEEKIEKSRSKDSIAA